MEMRAFFASVMAILIAATLVLGGHQPVMAQSGSAGWSYLMPSKQGAAPARPYVRPTYWTVSEPFPAGFYPWDLTSYGMVFGTVFDPMTHEAYGAICTHFGGMVDVAFVHPVPSGFHAASPRGDFALGWQGSIEAGDVNQVVFSSFGGVYPLPQPTVTEKVNDNGVAGGYRVAEDRSSARIVQFNALTGVDRESEPLALGEEINLFVAGVAGDGSVIFNYNGSLMRFDGQEIKNLADGFMAISMSPNGQTLVGASPLRGRRDVSRMAVSDSGLVTGYQGGVLTAVNDRLMVGMRMVGQTPMQSVVASTRLVGNQRRFELLRPLIRGSIGQILPLDISSADEILAIEWRSGSVRILAPHYPNR